MSLPSGLSRLFELEVLKGKFCGSQMVTSIGSDSVIFVGSSIMMWSFFSLQEQSVVINKKYFAFLFDISWKNWGYPESFLNGCRDVGITAAGLDPYAIPDSVFLATGVEKPRALVPPQTPMALSLSTSMGSTRQGSREASL